MNGEDEFGLVIRETSHWTRGVEVDIEVRVRSRDELQAAIETLKRLAARTAETLTAEHMEASQ